MGDTLILIELKEGVKEVVGHHLINNAGLNLVGEVGEGDMVCRLKNGKGRIEVIQPMKENEGVIVDETKGEVEGHMNM